MGSLIQALDNIPLHGGQHVVQVRKAALDELVTNGLTNGEIRHLLQRLNDEKDRFSKDICGELPIELLLCIAKYMDVREIIRARRVSRKWNVIFSNPDFCIGVIKFHFRGSWESNYNKSLKGSEKRAEKARLSDWLSRAAKWRMRREQGHYTHMSLFHFEAAYNNPDLLNDLQYSHGRVAFKSSDRITVKSLDDSSTMVFVDPDRQKLDKWLLSDELLVAKRFTSLVIFAWPLSQNSINDTKRYRVSLHSDTRYISASRFQVGIITTTNEVLLWDIQNGLRSIDTSRIDKDLMQINPYAFAIVLHPTNPDHLFVFHRCRTPDDCEQDIIFLPRTTVQEVTGDGSQALYWKDSIVERSSTSASIRRAVQIVTVISPTVKPMDTDGLYSIVWDPLWGPDRELGSLSMAFNIYTKEFSSPGFFSDLQEFQSQWRNLFVSSRILKIGEGLKWRDELLLPAIPMDNSKQEVLSDGQRVKNVLLAGFHRPQDSRLNNRLIFWCGGEGSNENDQLWGNDSDSFGNRRVCGDDDYVVLFGAQGYIVWYFKEDAIGKKT